MVAHPVEHDGHAALVGGFHQFAQVFERAVIGIYLEIILHGIRRTDGVQFSDRVDGHQPDHVDAQIFNRIEPRLYTFQVSRSTERPEIDLVQNDIGSSGHLIERYVVLNVCAFARVNGGKLDFLFFTSGKKGDGQREKKPDR